MKASELDKMFDQGESVEEHIVQSSATRPNWKNHRLHFDLPEWVIKRLDFEAKRSGLPRNSLLKRIIVEVVDKNYPSQAQG